MESLSESVKMNLRRERKFFCIMALIFVLSEIWKQFVLTAFYEGIYQWWFFPFQLCSIPIYLLPILVVFGYKQCRGGHFSRADQFNSGVHFSQYIRGTILCFLSGFTLLGGLIVWIDTSGMQYEYLPLTVHSYLWHILLVVVGVYAGMQLRKQCAREHLQKYVVCSVLLYLICCAIAEGINHLVEMAAGDAVINMFYINPRYYMEQAGFSSLTGYLPNNAVICIYIVMTIAAAVGLEFLFIRRRKNA